MSAHRLPQDMAYADWLRVLPDPGSGVAMPNSVFGQVALTLAAAGETNTLANPTKVGLLFTLTCIALSGGGTRIITAATKINTVPNTVITFTAVDQSVTLLAVPTATGARWQVVYNQGATLS